MGKYTSPLIIYFLVLLATSVVADPTIYTYKTVGDLQLKAAVYLPNTTSTDKHPIFFVVHGGGYLIGNLLEGVTAQEIAEVLSRGWAIVSIDYRLNPAALIDEIVQDMQDAYTWVRTELATQLPLDPDHITVFGGSAGGGLAVLAGYKITPRPQAVLSFYPYFTNWTDPYAYDPKKRVRAALVFAANNLRQNISEYDISDPKDPRAALFTQAMKEQKSGWLIATHDRDTPTDQVMAKLREFSASENVDSNFPPTYLAHGLKDNLVPYSQSVQMAASLKAKGIKYVLDLVPGVGHGFDMLNPLPDIWQYHVVPAFDFAQQFMNPSDSSSKTNVEKKFISY